MGELHRKAQQLPYATKEFQNFGIASPPCCAERKIALLLSRRTPGSLHGSTYELQPFAYRECDTQLQRSVDAGGRTHPVEETAGTP